VLQGQHLTATQFNQQRQWQGHLRTHLTLYHHRLHDKEVDNEPPELRGQGASAPSWGGVRWRWPPNALITIQIEREDHLLDKVGSVPRETNVRMDPMSHLGSSLSLNNVLRDNEYVFLKPILDCLDAKKRALMLKSMFEYFRL
jgi:hypothetical protein